MTAVGPSRQSEPGIGVNPFATRYTRPGAIAPLTNDGQPFDADALLAELAQTGGCGAFVGPHGSGKSTRLEACREAAAAQGQPVRRIRLRRWTESLAVARAIVALPSGGLVCVDSIEVAGRVGAACLRCLARLHQVQLLATTHAPRGLPVLSICRTSPLLLKRIIEQLPHRHERISDAVLEEVFLASKGNLREALFRLYDRAEDQRSPPRS